MKSIFVVSVVVLLFGESEMASQNPTTADELHAALSQAAPGDVITLLPIEYTGNFAIFNSGSEGSPITIAGVSLDDKSTVLSSGSGIIFDLKANSVVVKQLTLTNGDLALMVQGTNNLLKQSLVKGVAQGVILSGDGNNLQQTQVDSSSTGVTIQHGLGNSLDGCSLSSLTISDQASGGNVSGTQIKRVLDIKGSKYILKGVQVQGDADISGCDNELSSSQVVGNSRIAPCNKIDAPSNSFASLTQ